MSSKLLRIALTDTSLLPALRSFHPEGEYIATNFQGLGALVGQVDLFLLDDDTAIRFLGPRSEESWPSVVVTAKEGDTLPASFRQGLADDILLLPARKLDVERMLASHEVIQALRNLEERSRGVSGLVKKLQEDVQLAQKIQRRLIREKFAPLGPLHIKSKYWCGLKSGGDFFDFFEFPEGNHAGLILADSSSYSLSTGLIGSLMQFSIHVGRDELDNPERIVSALYGKLKEGMKEKDKLSLFYAILDRKTYAWRVVHCGGVYAARRGRNGEIEWAAKGENESLSLAQPKVPEAKELLLEPGDRLLVCSDGWGEAFGKDTAEVVEHFLTQEGDSQSVMNEMAFSLRHELEKASGEPLAAEDEFPMPPQDCSVLVFDLAANVLRL
ncbi:MAG TPA: SpoIIE family protein phosphatase, partial [Bdellovibrionota bacterium]